MSTVTTTFTSEDKDVVAALQRMTNETVKLREENKKLKEETHASGEKFKESLHEASNELVGNVAKLGTVAGAVGLVKEAYGEWHTKIKELSAISSRFHRELIADMAKVGDLAHAAEFQRFLKEVPGALPAEAKLAYAGVRAGLRNDAKPEQIKALTKEVAAAAPLFEASPERLKELGQTAGMIQRLDPTKTARQAANLAEGAMTHLRDGDTLTSKATERSFHELHKAGLSTEKSLAFYDLLLDAGMTEKSVSKIAGGINEDIQAPHIHRGHAMTAKERGQLKASRLKGVERVNAVLTDEDVQAYFAGESGATLEKVTRDKLDREAAFLQGAQTNRIQTDLGDLNKAFPSLKFDRQRRIEQHRAEEKAVADYGGDTAVRLHGEQFLEKQLLKENFAAGAYARVKYHAFSFFGDLLKGAGWGDEVGVQKTALNAAAGFGARDASGARLGEQFARDETKILAEIRDELKKQTRHDEGHRREGAADTAAAADP